MIIRAATLFVILFVVAGCSEETKPTPDDVQPALKAYLMAEKAKTCQGRVEVQRLTVTNVGDLDGQWGGWPVYATFSVTCYEGGNSSTWESNDPSDKAMAALVRKNAAGDYECFIPDMFRAAQEQIKKEMEKMLKK